MTLLAGTKLGRYEIRSQNGAGGMGEVYLAQDTKLDRKVALKIFPGELTSDQNHMRRNAPTMALRSPNSTRREMIKEVFAVCLVSITDEHQRD